MGSLRSQCKSKALCNFASAKYTEICIFPSQTLAGLAAGFGLKGTLPIIGFTPMLVLPLSVSEIQPFICTVILNGDGGYVNA